MTSPTAERWEAERSFHHSRYSAERIAAERQCGVSVCLPARECADTVGEIVRRLGGLRAVGAIDEIVVVDADSPDGTAAVAEQAGARVVRESELMPSFGPVLGKGDAMWRALSVLSGEVLAYVDADSAGFSEHFVTGLLGPLVCEPAGDRGSGEEGISFVKAFYRRPFEHGGVSVPDGGGRVNHLMARPALRLFYPELAGVRQPLAGEVAARRELLERIPFVTGYGVEIAMLIDVWHEVGLAGMAQVDLDEHRNRHQPIAALSKMAETVLATIAARMAAEGRLMWAPDGSTVLGSAGPGSTVPGSTVLGSAALGSAAPTQRPPLAEALAR